MNSYPLSRTCPPTRIFTTCLWIIIIINLGVIVHFGLFAKPSLSSVLRELSRFDLILHCLAFASLSAPAFLLFRSMIMAGLGIFALGAGLELAQWVATSREASGADLAANGVGIVFAALFVVMLRKADFTVLRPILGRAI